MLELIETARKLASGTPHKPRQADLRSEPAWRQVYRALEHGKCKQKCAQADKFGFPQRILDFANVFVEMQEKRHRADYHPSPSLIRSEVIADIEDCENAIKRLAFLGASGGLGAKIVSVFPDNPALGQPPIQGAIILLDAETGRTRALLDGTSLTEIRTVSVPPGGAESLASALNV